MALVVVRHHVKHVLVHQAAVRDHLNPAADVAAQLCKLGIRQCAGSAEEFRVHAQFANIKQQATHRE